MKNMLVLFLTFIATLSLMACTTDVTFNEKNEIETEDLPTLKVRFESEHIDAELGPSSWTITNSDGTSTAIETDTATPPELVQGKKHLVVPPESTLQLAFSKKPTKIMVNIWEENEQLRQNSTNMEIIVPAAEGLVIYEVITNWAQGQVIYAFAVEIQAE